MELLTLLGQIGLGVASNAVYDLIKKFSSQENKTSEVDFIKELTNVLEVNGVKMESQKIIQALAENGFLKIENSNFYAKESMEYGSLSGSSLIGNNSSFTTDKSAVNFNNGSFMHTQGTAFIKQDEEGNIKFCMGKDK
ncbi:MAG TPA: hypothetical protein DHW82_00595 [Spirochaetia bacterium]|nr:MAG: hypothetical protein A2Y41_06605 [Spirochaetes bacterium GWB1_36_13]HCL55498.1 hypothetical protein [Spirochaetia bacterium]